MKPILSCIVLCCLVFLGCNNSNCSNGNNGEALRFIKVSGNYKEKVTPDLFKCHLLIKQHGKTKDEAVKALEANREALYNTAKKLGIEKSSIEVSSVSERKERKWENGVSNVIGFIATQEITISISEKNKTNEFIQVSTELSEIELLSVESTLSSENEFKNKLSAKALENAMEKAAYLAQSIDAKIGSPISISEEPIHVPAFRDVVLTINNPSLKTYSNNSLENFSTSIEMEAVVYLTIELRP